MPSILVVVGLLTLAVIAEAQQPKKVAADGTRLFFFTFDLRYGEDMSAKRILVVDDNDDVRYILLLLLERSGGYETLEAATGEEAVEKAISGRPDVILTDIILPKHGPDSNYCLL